MDYDHTECTERDHVTCIGCGVVICTTLMSHFRREMHRWTRRCFDCRKPKQPTETTKE